MRFLGGSLFLCNHSKCCLSRNSDVHGVNPLRSRLRSNSPASQSRSLSAQLIAGICGYSQGSGNGIASADSLVAVLIVGQLGGNLANQTGAQTRYSVTSLNSFNIVGSGRQTGASRDCSNVSMVGQGNLVVVAVLDAVVGLVYQQIDLVILVNDNECVCVVAVVSLQLLSLGRSSVVSNVIVLINVDDYGIGYNLTSSDAVSGAAVEGQTLVRTNQLAGIRPVIADCNVALGLSITLSPVSTSENAFSALYQVEPILY